MNVLDIDIDVFYPFYLGDLLNVAAIDKSKDEFDKSLAEALAGSISISNQATVDIFEDHDEALFKLREIGGCKLLAHLDAHSDEVPSYFISNDAIPTLANWVSYAIAEDLVEGLISLTANEVMTSLHTRPMYMNGREIPFAEGSMRDVDLNQVFDSLVFDRVFITRSREWCNYSDDDLKFLLTVLAERSMV